MAWLMSKFYDWFMESAEEACLQDWRADLLAHARGDVLEVGAGTGVNLPLYPDEAISRLVLLEPDPHMRGQLYRMSNPLFTHEPVEVFPDTLEEFPDWMGPFDTVVTTLVLCSVPSPADALRRIRALLKPGGRFLFLEHVESHVPAQRRWQHRLEPIWKRFAGDCHLTRNTARAIDEAGFEIEQITREPMQKALNIVRPTVRGVAIRPA